MSDYLCISVTFLDSRYHGRRDGGEPEWPPSPLRLFQAIVAANADEIGAGGELDQALDWLEGQEPPLIVAPEHEVGSPYYLSVPNNAMDIVGRAWSRGNYFGSGDANPSTHRTMKPVRPVQMRQGETVHYAWKLAASRGDTSVVQPLLPAARRTYALGWGMDLVVAQGDLIATRQLQALPGELWSASSTGPSVLRAPIQGTLSALRDRHGAFLNRVTESGFLPVEPLSRFRITGYRRPTDPIGRPHAVFELRHDNGSFCRYPQQKLIHIAGMVRHLAKVAMERSWPGGVPDDWVERYVIGHRNENGTEHRQFSYLPLPSIGHEHADHAIRRVMIAAPVGDDDRLEHLALRLAGRQLIPDPKWGDPFGNLGPPSLQRIHRDGVSQCYTAPSNRWASVTPVILPGHDDHKPAKTRKLIDAALAQSGIEQPCTYEWSAFSRFRNSLSAHKYDRNKRPIFFKPDYLQELTSVHLTLKFDDQLQVPGPLVIGAGRHCGFGTMAAFQ